MWDKKRKKLGFFLNLHNNFHILSPILQNKEGEILYIIINLVSHQNLFDSVTLGIQNFYILTFCNCNTDNHGLNSTKVIYCRLNCCKDACMHYTFAEAVICSSVDLQARSTHAGRSLS